MKMIMYLGMAAMLAGCDGSKVDLETAKMNLANVTKERDDLKVQVATLQQQASSAKEELAKEKAIEAQATDKNGKPPMASKSGPAEASTSARSKHTHKS